MKYATTSSPCSRNCHDTCQMKTWCPSPYSRRCQNMETCLHVEITMLAHTYVCTNIHLCTFFSFFVIKNFLLVHIFLQCFLFHFVWICFKCAIYNMSIQILQNFLALPLCTKFMPHPTHKIYVSSNTQNISPTYTKKFTFNHLCEKMHFPLLIANSNSCVVIVCKHKNTYNKGGGIVNHHWPFLHGLLQSLVSFAKLWSPMWNFMVLMFYL